MKNYNNKKKTYQHLSIEERENIAIGLELKKSLYEISKELGRHRSTIWREIRRNNAMKYKVKYRAHIAQKRSEDRWKASHKKEWLSDNKVREYVEEKLEEYWSPEQIAGRIGIDKPGLKTNYESIYQFIYRHKRGYINKLRRGHRVRRERGSARNKRYIKVQGRIMIDERPASVNERKDLGHWEADTMVSRQSKAAIQVIVERVSRYTEISKLRAKTAIEMKNKLIEKLADKPKKLRKTITFDNGTENADHEIVAKELGVNTYFCHPYHSWEKGSVENTIGLIRQYLPKKSNFLEVSEDYIIEIENRLNNRPRKCLGYMTPKEIFSSAVALAP
ncbi:MAG: IS30 family transposase [Spirochaetes bacterium]|nr:MAG: IS30 family transposase [Spirochaetota bacterium]